MSTVAILQIRVGGLTPMPATGKPTGMFKTGVDGRVQFGLRGIVGDAVAEKRIHGGPEKAVHQFPIEHYARWAAAFPEAAAALLPGSVGENLVSQGATEDTVCIGDVYAFGSARLQVAQPRSPCVKLEQRFDADGLAAWADRQGCVGWYLRVLEAGTAAAGEPFTLVARNPDPIPLAEVWRLRHTLRPPLAALQRLIDSPGLSPQLLPKLCQRRDWLLAQSR